jgi:arylsulfatase A-like enzyme
MQFLSADEVSRRVLQEVDARSDSEQDLFLFVHFFDPHMPWYDARLPDAFAPEAFRSQMVDPAYKGSVDGSMGSIGYLTQARKAGKITLADSRQARGLYLSQVSWVDDQLGLLLGELESRGMLTDSLVVITSDHGETLDDSATDPYTHGPSVDLSAIHVPLILKGRGTMELSGGPRVVSDMVRLMDLPSTLLSVADLGEVMGDGQDLSGHWEDSPPSEYPHMAEATRPIWLETNERWNNLTMAQAVVQGGLIFQKRPQVVEDGVRSSHTLHALAPGQPSVSMMEPGGAPSKIAQDRFSSLRATLKQWNQGAPGFRPAEYDEETEAALRALGYLEAPP